MCRRRDVRKRRSGAAGQHGREVVRGRRKHGMPDRINAAVHAMEAPGAYPLPDPGLAHTEAAQLRARHEPVLLFGDGRHRRIPRGLVTFRVHLNP